MTETLCANCGKRPATEIWLQGGALDYVHGLAQRWCKRCVLETQLAHAQMIVARIPELTRRLQELE